MSIAFEEMPHRRNLSLKPSLPYNPLFSAESPNERSVVESIFNTLKNADTEKVNIGKILTEIEKNGIRCSDPRLKGFMSKIREFQDGVGINKGNAGQESHNNDIDLETFTGLVNDNIVFLSQIFRNKLVIPEFRSFCGKIKAIYNNCMKNQSGNVATYIPQLGRADPGTWACSVCTVDGQRFSLGEVNTSFTLQSCSKPFTYAICLNELGSEIVHEYVSHEPSGRNFNEICLDKEDKPHNPMLNSGAIMIAAVTYSLLKPKMRMAEKFDYMQNYIRSIAGGEDVGFNNAVFLSERDTADRNFAMAYYMKEHDCFPNGSQLQEVMDLYFQFCSLEVNTEGLSVMGATLANGGICPITGDKVLKAGCVRDVMSLMHSCGMYNYSGEFAFSVGLPAKSGVSGSLILVIPNLMAIALWSPPLDKIGNSVRGLQFCKELVSLFNFHRFDNLRYSEAKLDPRRHLKETQGLSIISLLFCATSGDVAALKRHYLQGIDLNLGDYDGRTALHVSASEGQKDCVRFLLDVGGTRLSPKDRWGLTPYEEAKKSGHEDIAKMIRARLLDSG